MAGINSGNGNTDIVAMKRSFFAKRHFVDSLRKVAGLMGKRSRQLTAAALALIFIVICNALFIYAVIEVNKDNARIVNYMGILRGSIQRITKLELSGVNSDEHIRNINTIFDEFKKSEVRLGAFVNSSRYKKIMDELAESWAILQREIYLLRKNNDAQGRIRILHVSENCWETANRLVSEIQSLSGEKLGFFKYVFIIIGTNIIAVISIMVLIRRYVGSELEYLASYDAHTNVLNKYSYNVILKQNINRIMRHRSALSLLILDIDNFKAVNDEYGHDAGDRVLVKIVELVSQSLRSSDVLCRIGGEEFAVIATETNIDRAYLLAEKIRALIGGSRFHHGSRVSISIGIAEYRENDSGESLFRRADSALYRAKRNGRNRVEIGWVEQLTGAS